MTDFVDLHVFPREIWSWQQFLEQTPRNSIALDGMVSGGPRYDHATQHANFDHHSNVVRDATMSTAKQVYFAIKGGIFETFRRNGKAEAQVYVNDPDQDTVLAVWLLDHYNLFNGTQGIPSIHRLLDLNDKLDITGGAFPLNLREKLVRQHNWIFGPYSQLRKSGALASAGPEVMKDNLETVLGRLNKFMMGEGGEEALDTRYDILHQSPLGYWVTNEIGGNDARCMLYGRGMNAYIGLVAERPDGRKVWSIGRKSKYIDFPVPELYDVYNAAEGLSAEEGWGGSDLIGGSSRKHGSKLSPSELVELTDAYLAQRKVA